MNTRTFLKSASFALACGLLAGSSALAAGHDYLVYVGTYTGPKSKGIYVYRMNNATGELKEVGLAAETPSPSFLAISPNNRFLYSVNEIDTFGGKKSGAVTAFSIDRESGKLTQINQQPSVGDGPCHLIVDKTGKNVLVANYGGGSVAVLPVDKEGKLSPASAFIQHKGSGVNAERQSTPHAHSINLDASNSRAFVADLGLDKVLVYKFDAVNGSLAPNDPPSVSLAPGSGPRHFAWHPKGRNAYVINEMKSTVTAFSYDSSKGALTELQTLSTLPAGYTGNTSTAEVRVHPSGKFLYGSNRGHDSIAVFAIDQKTGTLTHIENTPTQGKTPRNFAIDPSGRFLLAENSGTDTIVVFSVDQKTGRLTPTGQTVKCPSPVCVKFVPAK